MTISYQIWRTDGKGTNPGPAGDWAESLEDLLWGTQRIAAELGVRRETIHYHAGRDGFPESAGKISGSKVWIAEDVLRWWAARDGSSG